MYFNAGKYRSAIYLGGFFFLVSLYSFTQYVLLHSKSVILVSIFFYNFTFLSYLIGPLLYIYVRSVITDDSKLKNRDLWHLLPSLIFLLTALPYIYTSWLEKIQIASKLVEDINNIKEFNISVLYEIFPGGLIFLSRDILILAYLLWSSLFFAYYLIKRKESVVLSRQQFMIKWLTILLVILFNLVISHLLLLLEVVALSEPGFLYTLNLLQVLSGVSLTGLMISPLFFPSILYGLPVIPKPSLEKPDATRILIINALEHQKLKGLVFEAEYLRQIEEIVESSMREMKPYLQNGFNLPQLSVLTHIPIHHMAYFFKKHLKLSFHDYRNKWRVEYSKKLIMEGKAKGLTLEAIGSLSGFATRNTFFVAFKQVEGISPGEYTSRSSHIS